MPSKTKLMVYISQDWVRLSKYMFRPAIVAIIRLQSLMLKGIQYAYPT